VRSSRNLEPVNGPGNENWIFGLRRLRIHLQSSFPVKLPRISKNLKFFLSLWISSQTTQVWLKTSKVKLFLFFYSNRFMPPSLLYTVKLIYSRRLLAWDSNLYCYQRLCTLSPFMHVTNRFMPPSLLYTVKLIYSRGLLAWDSNLYCFHRLWTTSLFMPFTNRFMPPSLLHTVKSIYSRRLLAWDSNLYCFQWLWTTSPFMLFTNRFMPLSLLHTVKSIYSRRLLALVKLASLT
jgi:hypothetical protein